MGSGWGDGIVGEGIFGAFAFGASTFDVGIALGYWLG